MLSAKRLKIHGMRGDKWSTRDQLNQYRGILKLHARDKTLRASESVKLKKRVSRELEGLKVDVKQYREIVGDLVLGDERRTRNTLKHHREFRLAYSRRGPKAVFEAVHQDCDFRRRQLDKLCHERKNVVQIFINLQLERDELSDQYKQEQNGTREYVQQHLVTRFQQSMAKQNAAKAIYSTYLSMLNILKEDAAYFDAILIKLKNDQRSQCKVILKATIMGQLAAENLDDARKRYKEITKDVWDNIKAREHMLSIARTQVADLWAYAQSLVRIESDPTLTKTDNGVMKISEDTLNNQIEYLEGAFDKVKQSLLVRSYHELLPRFEEQTRQRERLMAQFEYNIKQRDLFLNQTQQAELTLRTLQHTVAETTGQYRIDKKAMLEQIQIQKKRETDHKKMRKARGELLMSIRAALQNMVSMLTCVKLGGRSARHTSKEGDKRSSRPIEEKEEADELDEKDAAIDSPIIEKMDTDGLMLLSHVSRKVGTLFGMSSFELDAERGDRAKDLYQTYVSDHYSNLKFGQSEPEPTGLLVEHEMIDTSVLTRADIKLLSRQVVEVHTKLE